MKNQYKPSKPQKLKASKPAKAPKQPKAPKAEKLQNFGAAKTVKFDKPKKVKDAKVKAPKPEKALVFKPGKVEKAEQFKGVDKLKKPVNAKTLAAVLVAVAVVAISVVLVVNLRDNEPVIKPFSLSVTQCPGKTIYYVDEIATFDGLKLSMTLTNGVSIAVDGSECEISGFDSSEPVESQVITVTYKELQATFTITIKELSVNPPAGSYTGISFKTLPKTEYKVKEWLDPTGGVLLVNYDDGTVRELPLDDDNVKIYGFTSDKPGTYTLTVKYVEAGLYGETTYTITVME